MSEVKKSKSLLFICISLILILIGTVLSYSIDTNGGTVKIERLKLVDKDGYTVSAVIRIPKTATSETPAPAMIVVPGGDCTADIAAPWAIELTRRGYVTLTMDYTGAGDTEVNMAEQYWGTNGTMHLSTGYDYLTSLDFVDQDNIGAGGHSMGSLYSYRLALHRKVNVVVSDVIFFDDLPDYDFNFVQLTAIHDEGILSRVSTYEDVYKDPLLTGLFGVDRIEPGKLYGSWENNTARIFYEFNHTHQDDMISPKLISRMVDCVTLAMPTGTRLDSNNLVYGWKILGLFVAISGMVMFLFSFASVLLKTKVFGKLVLKPGARVGFEYGKPAWWLYAVILTLIPVATFFPGTAIGNRMQSNNLFKLGTTPNGYMVWALVSAAAVLVFFAVYHFTSGRKQNGSLKSYGLATVDEQNKITLNYILRSLVFSAVILASAYALLMFIFYYGKTDLHLIVLSLRPFNGERFSTYPWYFIALIPYFFSLMLASNGLNFTKGDASEGRNLRKTVVFGSLFGIVGLTILYAVFQILLRFTPIGPFYTGNFAQFYMTLLEAVIPEFIVATGLGIYLKKKTNTIWPGMIIGAALIAFFLVSSNCLAMIIGA
jgi:hypothetical protein